MIWSIVFVGRMPTMPPFGAKAEYEIYADRTSRRERVEPPMTAASSPADELDLSACERELVRTPESIQPHGFLLVAEDGDLRISRASENLAAFVGVAAGDVLGRSVLDYVAGDRRDALEERLLAARVEDENPSVVVGFGTSEAAFDLVVHRSEGRLVLEFEPSAGDDAERTGADFRDARIALARVQRARDLEEIGRAATEEVRRITGFDRVMLYRFDEDWHGEVVAEQVAPGLESFFGLHYPASDIPSQARELYKTNWLRYIRDVAYEPAPLRSHEREPIDLGAATLRSVSPVHLRYLRNMGVGATLTVSLLENGRLWGLIAAHHRTPKPLPFQKRAACELIGRTVSLQIAALEENAALAHRVAVNDVHGGFVHRFSRAGTIAGGLAAEAETLLRLTGADGVAVCTEGRTVLAGATPSEKEIGEIVAWLAASADDDVFAVASLSALDPRFEPFAAIASGLLAVDLSGGRGSFILWFRREFRRSVSWGGDPSRPALRASDGRIEPRTSFAKWTEIVRGRARPWEAWQIEAAGDVRRTVLAASARRSEELTRENDALAKTNSELDAFTQIASHDLKEPLRGIHNYANYLVEDYGEVLDDDGREKLQTLVRLTKRMDTLIESLLHLSRIGRVDFEDYRTNMDDVVAGVLDLFGPRLEERRVDVTVHGPLPFVRCDERRIAEVVNNLLSNAIKYSERARPHIEIGVDRDKRPPAIDDDLGGAATFAVGDAPRFVTFFVRDDGIGIREKHLRTIFRMFKRLHAPNAFGGGTGAGLAIARKIVERHGGVIWAESTVGVGTTFFFTLPEAG